jgi:hypothetical protein
MSLGEIDIPRFCERCGRALIHTSTVSGQVLKIKDICTNSLCSFTVSSRVFIRA